MPPRLTTRLTRPALLLVLCLLLAACGQGADPGTAAADAAYGTDVPTEAEADAAADDAPADDAAAGVLRIGAIPDQDPEVLSRQFSSVADVLGEELGVTVEYVPVSEYTAAVNLLATGDLDLVWYGAVTGIQARLQTPTAEVIAQRDIDAAFTSTFIAAADAGIAPFEEVAGLSALAGTRFTFGSESSTSSRLMPQSFMDAAGVALTDLAGEPGFAGSHDAVIDLVESGSFQTGVLGTAIWEERVDAGEVDLDRVTAVFQTPPYPNYHWVLDTRVEERLGEGFGDQVRSALLGLSADDPEEAEVLELFAAGSFIPAAAADFDEMEAVARELGLIVE